MDINKILRQKRDDVNDFREYQERDAAKYIIGKYYLFRWLTMNGDDIFVKFAYGIVNEIYTVMFDIGQIHVSLDIILDEADDVCKNTKEQIIRFNSLGSTSFIFETEEEVLEQIERTRDEINKIKEKSKK